MEISINITSSYWWISEGSAAHSDRNAVAKKLTDETNRLLKSVNRPYSRRDKHILYGKLLGNINNSNTSAKLICLQVVQHYNELPDYYMHAIESLATSGSDSNYLEAENELNGCKSLAF
ncbi:hypothetical protein EG68_11341 [Paragonimus skrjabini miyazakii]|uniref:Uncharacterized protein n=1 Tax=Paragonimus skrjabini miyazakii TaxID=59628 RepID=A0A8S9YEQ2_9TREM|nr:hypothetical protein EG68_11341 [Paragonimus skrjabini miyazakii]